ncbi:death-associated protein kinase related [Bactrocera dorsalis]|uniref:Death-associated protein kinase related n=1 Tax=Bactrocera dorsalis TaxID=27457 RepID=A0ABM3JLA9_BACDO|nr:death-associated protein kinase related [Bactrocera dorsalis]XP_049310010.1 death-associated protein kinase related [Bactrocera dorsalis]XP_049310011.1 death-associated protein kinase related [Bactrocera dorsalis]XP_049310012.1 death-associated protein kinase related [Bactrocera dorsalis]XP_049310014.1 death-associated protein kinase related [Bactrocera dorsalis]XP_049310015.1 death-associated protein kinase related [Bactrocera dorsalis]XP_049310016.1 death-associated protein kinase relate
MIYIDDSEPEGELEPVFPYRDVTIRRGVDANELYEILGEVGRGKFGTVYKCQEKENGLKLAAKFVPIPKREDRRNVEREVEIMNSLQHHLIIQLYAAYEHQKMMCVVLELVEGGELFDRVVDDEFVLTERVCVVFIRQVCEAMEFIHRNNILHLDLKPENILCLTQEGNRIKIIDFGLARKYDPNKRLQILFGTPEFVAPEVVNFDCISYATDMWSVGVICYVLISGLSPFMGETDIETMANVTIAKYDFEDESFSNVSPECLDFIGKLLVKDLQTRMTAAQCLEHNWLQRRPKPPKILAPKPSNVPPPKLKAATPSPVPPQEEENVEDLACVPEPEPAATVEAEKAEKEAIVIPADTNTAEAKELDTTKDNLKNFIERWEEHPNSPYVFDVESNVIAPLSETSFNKTHGRDSISSSRVCSPSPCESIETIIDDDVFSNAEQDNDSPSTLATPINESREKLFPSSISLAPTSGGATPTPTSTTPTPQPPLQYGPQHLLGRRGFGDEFGGSGTNLNQQERSMKSYLHTFDRRNSDTSYLIGRRASGERVNLADEIRKLSDHLLMLAEINTKLGSETKLDADANNNKHSKAKASGETTKVKTNATTKESTSKKTATTSKNKVAKTESSEYTTVSSNTATTSTSNTTTSYSSSVTSANGVKSKFSTVSMRLQQSIEETPKLTNGGPSFGVPWKSSINSTTNKSSAKSTTSTVKTRKTVSVASNEECSLQRQTHESASVRRAKFRINQMSRDVPIGVPNIHQAVNLEEAANTTKDCLLHLLEKYNENESNKCRNPMTRHQSISVDWNVSDNLEYRSMSSINAFFQRHNNTGEHVRQLQAQLENKTGSTASGKSSGGA